MTMKTRLSELQKVILGVLSAKDITDWDEFYKISRPNLKAPYWHALRDTYSEPRGGDTCGRVIEIGVRNMVKKLTGQKDPCFTASFGRSIKGLIKKNLVEERRSDKDKQTSEIKLSELGLKVNAHSFNLNNKEVS